MTVSTFKSKELSPDTTTAMPKINVRPVRVSSPDPASDSVFAPSREAAQPGGTGGRTASAAPPKKHADWDVRFALGLIVLIVVVNASLTFLLGGDTTHEQEDIFLSKEEALTVSPDYTETVPAASHGALRPTQRMSVSGNNANASERTEVFISPEDKRVLLRQLNQAPPNWREGIEKRNVQDRTGTYRALEEQRALSIIQKQP